MVGAAAAQMDDMVVAVQLGEAAVEGLGGGLLVVVGRDLLVEVVVAAAELASPIVGRVVLERQQLGKSEG